MTATPEDILRDRVAAARAALTTAENNLRAGDYDAAANRAYYAAFHAARALLGSRGIETRKHAGVLAFFDREFIRTGGIDVRFSRMLHGLFESRSVADYRDLVHISEERASDLVAAAREFVETIEHALIEEDLSEPDD